MRTINRTVVILRPKQPFIDWVRQVDPDPVEAEDIAGSEPTAYLIPEVEDERDVRRLMKLNFELFFEEELAGWYNDEAVWPHPRTFKMFEDWFHVSFSTMVVDLVEEPIIIEDL